MWVTSSLKTALTPTAVALGNFDGVHRGHEQVVKPIFSKQHKTEMRVGNSENSYQSETNNEKPDFDHNYATVVTFNPHPQEFFSGQPRALLTPLSEKVQQLRSLDVEQLVLLPFDRELSCLSPQEFVEIILVKQLRARSISVGSDFCFGHRRSGTSADLQAIAASFGIEVTIVPLQTFQGERISSSFIRQALLQGDITQANRLLGRPYTIIGQVVQGQKLGRTLGFPTANLQLPPEKFLPRQGVYCVRVSGSNLTQIPAVMNIGLRPTVEGTNSTVEVYLLDWYGDLYGQTLTVSLEKFLRSEQKFPSLDALKSQIQADCEAARGFFLVVDGKNSY